MIGVGILLGLFILIILLLPFLLDLNRYRDQYLPVLEEALDRKVDVEDIRLTLFPTLGVQLQKVVIADNPAFSSQPFMTVPSVQVAVQWRPLLEKRVQVESVLIEDPVVKIIRSETGELNTSTLGKVPPPGLPPSNKDKPQDSVSPLLGMFAVEQFAMTGGTLDYEDRTQKPPQTYQIQSLTMNTESVAIGKTALINVNGMVMPYQLPVEVKGRVGPIQANLDIPELDINGKLGEVEVTTQGAMTNGQLTMDVRVPQASTGDVPIEFGLEKPVRLSQLEAHLVAGLFSTTPQAGPTEVTINPLRANLHLGGSTVHVSGKGTPSHFSLVGNSPSLASQDLPLSLPVQEPFLLEQVEFEAKSNGTKLYLKSLKAKVFEGVVLAQGVLDQTGPPFHFSTKGTFKDFSIHSLAKVIRPSSLSMTGAGELDWNVTGVFSPSQPLKIDGPTRLTLQKGEVIGFDLVKTIEDALQISGVLGKPTGATQFSLIDAKTALEADGLAVRELIANAPNFSLRSVGKLGIDQSVNFRGTLGVPAAIADKIIRRFPMAKMVRQKGQLLLPFVVKGTTQDPVFRLDTQSIGTQVQKEVEKRLEKVLQGDDQELQKLMDEGKGLLQQFFRK